MKKTITAFLMYSPDSYSERDDKLEFFSSCAGIDMAPSWRDYVRLIDIVGAVLVVVFAGWFSQFAPVVMAWLKTVFN